MKSLSIKRGAGVLAVAIMLIGQWSYSCCAGDKAFVASRAKDANEKALAYMVILLGNLATERYIANSNRNVVVVFAVHYGKTVKSFTDNQFTVISLPASDADDYSVLCTYVNTYNGNNFNTVDSLIERGKYQDAKKLCQLISHFSCPESYERSEADKRLPYLEKLVRGEEVEANRTRLRSLHSKVSSYDDYSLINVAKPEVVTNLFEIIP